MINIKFLKIKGQIINNQNKTLTTTTKNKNLAERKGEREHSVETSICLSFFFFFFCIYQHMGIVGDDKPQTVLPVLLVPSEEISLQKHSIILAVF